MKGDPVRTVCDGRVPIGHVFARHDGRFDATDENGEVIGDAASINAAVDLILRHRREHAGE